MRHAIGQIALGLRPADNGSDPVATGVGGAGRFNGLVDALNRLPRPILALGTPGLFLYAIVDPAGFSIRMRALALVPEPLWWLVGAVVTFYFGAREAHYRRVRTPVSPANPALEAWRTSADTALR